MDRKQEEEEEFWREGKEKMMEVGTLGGTPVLSGAEVTQGKSIMNLIQLF